MNLTTSAGNEPPTNASASIDFAPKSEIEDETIMEKAAKRTESIHSHESNEKGQAKKRLRKLMSYGSEMIKISFTDVRFTVTV